MNFESDTDDMEDDLDGDACETKCHINVGFDEAINRAVNMTDSMLVSEICVTSSGSPVLFDSFSFCYNFCLY